MYTAVGRCSICGNTVMGNRGDWNGSVPPPPDTCRSCGATRADEAPRIPPRSLFQKIVDAFTSK